VPSITAGSLASGDAATLTQMFDNANVGTTHTITPAITFTSGSAAGYSITLVNKTNQTITAKPLTVTGLSATTKIYDASTSATLTGTPSLVGVISGDTVSLTGTASGAFADKNVGNGKTVSISGLSITGS